MATFHVIAGASDTPEFPIVRKIGPADLTAALRQGFADFWAMPRICTRLSRSPKKKNAMTATTGGTR